MKNTISRNGIIFIKIKCVLLFHIFFPTTQDFLHSQIMVFVFFVVKNNQFTASLKYFSQHILIARFYLACAFGLKALPCRLIIFFIAA